MNFGTIGRCGCGSIGERRDQFSGEPICSPCVTQRSGRVITLRDAISTERAVGTLTRDQRQARVRYLRDTYDIASLADHFRGDGWLTTVEAARQLGVHPATAKRFALEGVLRGMRANDKGDILIAPLTGPLPSPHPGKRFKDRRRFAKLAAQMRQEVQYEA